MEIRDHLKWLDTALLISILVWLLPARSDAQNATPLVIQGGTLIDATGRPPLEDAVIVIEGNRFRAVGKRGAVTVPKGSRIIDVKGKTILPGLIDGHCHLLDFVGELYLHLGITTCPDITQNDDEWTMAQRDGTNLGKIHGPRIWSTGARLVGPPPPWALRTESGYLIKSPEDARAIVRKKKEAGIEIIKFNEYVSPEAIKAGAEEANRLGLPVTCHCLDVFLAAEAGFAGVEHHWAPGMTSIADVKKRWEVHELRMTGKINTADVAFYYEPENFDKIIKAMAEKKVSWSPTIATWFRPLSPSAERFKERELSILDNPRAAYLPAVMREQTLRQYDRYAKFPADRLKRTREGYSKIADFIARFVQAGGIIRAGSDPNNGLPALGVHQEMVMFVEAGSDAHAGHSSSDDQRRQGIPQGQGLRHRGTGKGRRLDRRGGGSPKRHVGGSERETGRPERRGRR